MWKILLCVKKGNILSTVLLEVIWIENFSQISLSELDYWKNFILPFWHVHCRVALWWFFAAHWNWESQPLPPWPNGYGISLVQKSLLHKQIQIQKHSFFSKTFFHFLYFYLFYYFFPEIAGSSHFWTGDCRFESFLNWGLRVRVPRGVKIFFSFFFLPTLQFCCASFQFPWI